MLGDGVMVTRNCGSSGRMVVVNGQMMTEGRSALMSDWTTTTGRGLP